MPDGWEWSLVVSSGPLLDGIAPAVALGMRLSPLPLTPTVLVALVAASAIACSREEPSRTAEGRQAWRCTNADVPMGQAVRCVQSALGGSYDSADPGAEEYDCTEGDSECPSALDTLDGAGSTGGSDDSESDTSDQNDFGTGTPDTTSPPSDETSGPGSPDEPEKGGCMPGNGKGRGGSRSDGPGSECSFVPELPYCGGSESAGGEGGANGNTPPGQSKKTGDAESDSTSSSSSSGSPPASSSSSSSGGAERPGGKKYRCAADKKGNKKCESVPECVAGARPSACGACVPDGEESDCVPPSLGGCWVTGGGFIVGPNVTTGAAPDGKDNFGGNAKPMKDGRIQGHWNHVDHGTGNHAKGKPEYIVCRHVDEPGPGQPGGKKGFTMNQVYFGGPAEWRVAADSAWASGYWFDVVVKDHGEPGSVPHAKNGSMPDTYHFTIRKIEDEANKVSGAIVYETKETLGGGNIQVHPPNKGHSGAPMALPPWVSLEP